MFAMRPEVVIDQYTEKLEKAILVVRHWSEPKSPRHHPETMPIASATILSGVHTAVR